MGVMCAYKIQSWFLMVKAVESVIQVDHLNHLIFTDTHYTFTGCALLHNLLSVMMQQLCIVWSTVDCLCLSHNYITLTDKSL